MVADLAEAEVGCRRAEAVAQQDAVLDLRLAGMHLARPDVQEQVGLDGFDVRAFRCRRVVIEQRSGLAAYLVGEVRGQP